MALTKAELLNTQDLIRGWLIALPKQMRSPRGAQARRQVLEQLEFILDILAEHVAGLAGIRGSEENIDLARKLKYFLELEIVNLSRARALIAKGALAQVEAEELFLKSALLKAMILGEVKPRIRALQLAA